MTERPRLSVVIPTLDEAGTLPHLLRDLAPLAEELPTEVIVVDGGSTDGTVEAARRAGARVLSAPAGRGQQLRAGASEATGTWLLFLHADSRLDAKAIAAVVLFVAAGRARDFAHFRLKFGERGPFLSAIEAGQRVRERLFGLVYGDQGLLVSRGLYDESGGYPAWDIMEDVGIVDRLVEVGRRVPLNAEIRTSARRYLEEGPVRAWLRNVRLITRFRLGAPSERLADDYVPRRSRAPQTVQISSPSRQAVVVFLKEPVAGRVKTRLAADIGAEEALRIYRALASSTVDAVRGGPWRVILYVDPPEASSLTAVKEWLGGGVEVRPQQRVDLGGRMASAIAECLVDADAVCVVGSDIPGITTGTVVDAFSRLGESDVVFGPATDGGYYLVGMRRAAPELFAGVEWSTERVLEQSLARAARAKLRVALLPERTDVDTLPDVPPALLTGTSGA